MYKNEFLKIAKEISEGFKNIPLVWDGRKSILEMKETSFPHWKQMEWIGWYFQFLCEKFLKGIVEIPGPKFGNSRFDGFFKIPWDFKAHAINTSAHQIIVNDSEAIAKGIEERGSVGVILALGKVEYNDEKRTFQKWHEQLKGGKSKYELERIKRGAWSRLRKTKFSLEQISFIKIDDSVLIKCGSFQRDFRNSNGRPRREKVLLDLEKLDEEIIYFLNFKQNK
jgi:hypothetical protein